LTAHNDLDMSDIIRCQSCNSVVEYDSDTYWASCSECGWRTPISAGAC